MPLPSSLNKDALDPFLPPCTTERNLIGHHLESCRSLPSPSEWQYRIEGGQKVIFFQPTKLGTPGAEGAPKVLCVDLSPRGFSQLRWKRWKRPGHQILFCRYLGRYLLQSTPVRLSESYIVQLAHAAETLRPLSRRLDKNFSSAALDADLFPDLALRFGQETALVELKPKSGILSRSALVHPTITDSLKKFHIPPYYFKNYLFPKGPEEARKLPDVKHRYDPVKMLSGRDVDSQLRILHTERARGLRLFHRGVHLKDHGELRNCHDGFCQKALDVAAKALSDVSSTGDCCLRSLRSIQRHDYLDNIGAALLLQRLMEQVGKSRAYEMIEEQVYQKESKVLHPEDEEEFLASKRIVCYESSEEAIRLHSFHRYRRATQEVMRMKPAVCARMLSDFLQAAAAKDCSFMVSLCRQEKAMYNFQTPELSGEPIGSVEHDGQRWLYSIRVIDVGAKSIDKITQKWPAKDFEQKNLLSSLGGIDRLL